MHDPKTQHGPDPNLGSVDELAADYLSRVEDGERVDQELWLARLDPGQRAEFQALLRGARVAGATLPRAVGPGTLLAGRYRLDEEIGRGGMGKVFQAFDEKLERPVAVKMLGSLLQGDEEQEALLLKESRLLAALKHPGIVGIHEAGHDGDLTFLVMDLVEGASLSQVIERARASLQRRHGGTELVPKDGKLLREAIQRDTPSGREELIDERSWYRSVTRILLEIARTLEAAHGAHVIHRDLKPNNIMLVGGGHPVLLDFGLAGSANAAAGEVTQGLYGTVAYLAPEQARTHQVGVDPRTDVYQLGLVLYELLTLRRAYPGEGIGAVLENIKNGFFKRPRKLNPQIPADLEAICLKCMELAPEHRYATARELREDLQRYLGGDAPLAVKQSRARRWTRSTRLFLKRNPLPAAAAGMVLVGALAWSVKAAFFERELPSRIVADFRVDRSRNEVVLLEPTTKIVRGGDLLGVDLYNPSRPAYVYALSIFGAAREGQQRQVSPMRPMLLEDWLADQDAERAGAWDLKLDRGRHRIACTQVYESAGVDWEGLILYVLDEPDRGLDTWFDKLAVLEENEEHVTLDDAAVQLEVLTGKRHVRGGRIDDMSAEKRADFNDLAESLRNGSAWAPEGTLFHEVICQVERVPESEEDGTRR